MIDIEKLSVKFDEQVVLNDVSFSVGNGEIVGVVGESGSGKSMTALSIMGLLPGGAQMRGRISLDECDLVNVMDEFREHDKCYDDSLVHSCQGSRISMVFQDPMTSLNPTFKIGRQVGEVLKIHTDMNRMAIKEAVIKILTEVGLSNADKVYDSYPHQLSGGMRQRVMIAMGIILQPDILIADEPTTALDVTIQKQILALIKQINEKHNTGVLFITHNLNLVRNFCDRVIVMQNGRIVETGTVEQIFNNPQQQYTQMLLSAITARTRRRRVVHSYE